ncbi:MAG: site-specific integrase, partial [Anaerolineae bacterium]|nr:site-specific integrase [Anaerolineae bacterium]
FPFRLLILSALPWYAYPIIPVLGHRKINTITALDVQHVMTISANVTIRDQRYIWQTFSSCFGYMLDLGVMLHNPAARVSKPSNQQLNKSVRFLTEEQAHKLIDVSENYHLYTVALATGAREGELLGLTWDNINWDASSISVVKQLKWSSEKKENGDRFYFSYPKTQGSIRHIKIGPKTLNTLKEQRERVKQLQGIQRKRWREFSLVFPSIVGTPIEPTNLIRRFKKVLKKAGLPIVRFHDLRHTHATLLLLKGIHPKIVSERLGHKDILTTLRQYSHVLPSLQEEASHSIEDVLFDDETIESSLFDL